jgi:metabolite-proton symporter
MVKAVVAACVGTAIEWYDYFLYGLAAALVFPNLFFPSTDPLTGTFLAFSTYFVGFLARPIGAAIFGHFGDRIGRKATLVATLLLMGIATVAVGLMPTYAQVGIWGALGLTALRVLQGIGVGGEWGGSVLLSMEWSDGKRRGFIASWPQFGVPVGLIMANGALALCNEWAGPEGFLQWGWRIPFLLSAALILVGLYIRLGVQETPTFSQVVAERRVEAQPVAAVLRVHWREVLLTTLARTGQQSAFYIFTTFILVYATRNLDLSRGHVLNLVLMASAASLISIPLFGYLSDVIGRKPMYIVGTATLLLFIFPYFWALDSKIPGLIAIAVWLALPVHDMAYSPQAALIAESFTPRLRYTGASLGYHLASITAGGPAALVALWLLSTFKSSLAIAAYIALGCVISLIATAMLPERSGQDVSEEYDGVQAASR